MKYIKEFENHSQYQTYTADTSNFILPNVSLCVQENEVHYNPYVEPIKAVVVCKYYEEDISSQTTIATNVSNFSAMEIDGVEQSEVDTYYQFDTLGEHTVTYTLTDPTIIGDSAFQNCGRFTGVTIPNSVTSIGEATFSGSNLKSIDIPSSVTIIGDTAFGYCEGLSSVTIPNSVTSIGSYAFSNCYSLESIIIPSSVTSISDEAFVACLSLTSITVNATTPPTLDTDVFYNTNDCPIYVPSGSVDAYKAAENWSDYASRIQAIP